MPVFADMSNIPIQVLAKHHYNSVSTRNYLTLKLCCLKIL
jgi:hypothetical protein